MKQTTTILLFLVLSLALFGQANDMSKGIVSYISSQNIYVQFVNTDGIEIGDTLFALKNDSYIPALKVKETSSISCLCTILNDYLPAVRNQVFAKMEPVILPTEVAVQNSKQAVSLNDQIIADKKKTKTDKNKA